MGMMAEQVLAKDLTRALEDWDTGNLEIQLKGQTAWLKLPGFLSEDTEEGYNSDEGVITPYTRQMVYSPQDYVSNGNKIRVGGSKVYLITAVTSNEGVFIYSLKET